MLRDDADVDATLRRVDEWQAGIEEQAARARGADLWDRRVYRRQ